MAYDNAQMAQAWGDLLGLTPEQVDQLQDDLDQWAMGGARLATWSRLATDVNLFNNAAVAMVHDWYGGTADGGPNGDGMYPMMNSEAEVFLVPSPARVMTDLSGFIPQGELPSVADLPDTGSPGDLWTVDGDAWAWNEIAGEWRRLGRFRGVTGYSAKQIVIAAGDLPADASDQDYADWVANSQIDKVQPYLTDAEAARDAAQQAQRDTEALAAQAEGDAQATAADRLATAADREATGLDRVATGQDAQATAADRAATDSDRTATGAERTAAAAAAQDADTARRAAETAQEASAEDRLATAADRVATGEDRTATGQDKQATAADRVATGEDAQATAADRVATGQDRAASSASAEDADTARRAAEAAQAAAEQARDEAEAIAGGDFVTGPTSSTEGRLAVFAGANGRSIKEGPAFGVGAPGDVLRRSDGDGRYRAAGDVPLAEVTGLADALDGKQNDLGFTPADAADTYTKGEVDAAFEALPDPPDIPEFAAVAEVRAGTADGKIISPKVMADALATVALTPATATVGLAFSGFINAEIALTSNLTVGPPSGGFARKTGEIDFVQDATGGRTVAFHADYIVPANFSLQATANGRTSVPYRYQANGKVRLYNPSKWSA